MKPRPALTTFVRVVLVVLVGSVGSSLAGCGGGKATGSSPGSTATNQGRPPATTATASVSGGPSGGVLAAATSNPCSLITLDEAQALFGGVGMQPTQVAPGPVPTCTYRDVKGDHDLDVGVLSTSVTANKGVLHSPQAVGGLGHDAYCDPREDRQIADMFVGIDSGHTLWIVESSGGTSCALAAQFAQKALSRLSGGTLAAPSSTPPTVAGGVLANASAYPCSMVTSDEAAAIFGVGTQTAQIIGGRRPACRWFTSDINVSVAIWTDTISSPKSAFANPNPVSGLGAEAYCDPLQGQADLVVVIDANHYLEVQATKGSVTCDQAQQFAQKALPRV